MNTFDWFLIGMLGVIALCLGFVIAARMVGSRSRKMAYAQAQINKKQGATGGVPPAATTVAVGTGAPPITPLTHGERTWKWFKEYFWIVLGTIIAGLLLWWGWTAFNSLELSQSPSLKTVWEWTKRYWHLITFALVVAYVLSYFIKKEMEPMAKAIRGVLILASVMLFAVLPVLVTAQDDDGPAAACSTKYGSSEWRDCLVTEKGVVLTSDGKADYTEFELCTLESEKARLKSEWIGPRAIRIWSEKGTLQFQHKMVAPKDMVGGKCPAK